MTTVTAYRWGRHLFVLIWLIGLGLLAAMAAGVIPGHLGGVLAIVLGLSVTIAIGVLSQRCGFLARPVVRVDGACGRVALTFDDGPDPEFTPKILDLLAQLDQKATFFVIGSKVAKHGDIVRRIVDEGHEVGNHTMEHRWHLALWSVSRITDELDQVSDLVQQVTQARPRLFRPPAGALSPRIEAGAAAAGLRLVGFSTRSGDGSAAVSAELARKRLVAGLRPGAILLLHDAAPSGRAPTSLVVLPPLCAAMTRAGLRSVTLSEMIAPVDDHGDPRTVGTTW